MAADHTVQLTGLDAARGARATLRFFIHDLP
jgi:hypothetical protein